MIEITPFFLIRFPYACLCIISEGQLAIRSECGGGGGVGGGGYRVDLSLARSNERMELLSLFYIFFRETRLRPHEPQFGGVSKCEVATIYPPRAPPECFLPHHRLTNERINTFNILRGRSHIAAGSKKTFWNRRLVQAAGEGWSSKFPRSGAN